MASKRKLKKAVDYWVSDLVIDCMSLAYIADKKDQKKAFKIIEDVLKSREEIRGQINHPDGTQNQKLVKKHFLKVRENAVKSIEKAYEKLEKLAAKKD